ncbi:hypothetical protein [Brucella anthropi]|uniref:Uncharacterized protein n=1 Tax=Brucella anthropi TaxID=529 RepID=A0A6L3Z4R3_BRUAN|nr:hypothetical protein [Brucella anthropi]KAB2768609.1 hypothetical protein F9L04_13115 [Brucella anthropi]
MTAVSALVEQWIASHGGPRRFECGVRSGFDATQYELQGFGVEVRRKGNRFAVKRVDGRWQVIGWEKLVELRDYFRRLNGREPLRRIGP